MGRRASSLSDFQRCEILTLFLGRERKIGDFYSTFDGFYL